MVISHRVCLDHVLDGKMLGFCQLWFEVHKLFPFFPKVAAKVFFEKKRSLKTVKQNVSSCPTTISYQRQFFKNPPVSKTISKGNNFFGTR